MKKTDLTTARTLHNSLKGVKTMTLYSSCMTQQSPWQLAPAAAAAAESSDLTSMQWSFWYRSTCNEVSDTRRLQIRRGSRFIHCFHSGYIVPASETDENRAGFSSEPIILRSNFDPPDCLAFDLFSVMSPLSDTIMRFCRRLIHDSFEHSL